jgi:DNA polymerase III epsilon subunit-like protein|uniref:DNA polymerase III subunit alpha n=1 Tax=Siphoviridae sp. ct6bb17 TaxID=2825345 RepID=A0A8S5NXT7_9CAUD|nr:MAG TPA: DNA polymerase III subunit alpha [Siphoviridae sp. ct6bb17]
MIFEFFKKLFSNSSTSEITASPIISKTSTDIDIQTTQKLSGMNKKEESDNSEEVNISSSTSKKKSSLTPYMEARINKFNQTLESLEKYDIQLSNSFKPFYTDDETKFSNITPKMSTKKLNNFVVIDTETTGLRASSAIIELSAIRFVDYEPVSLFTTLLKPTVKISEGITIITGITNEMIKNAPNIKQVAESFIDFVGDSPVVGHNLPFDIGVLENKGIYLGKRKYYDTLKTSKRHLKGPRKKWDKELYDYVYVGDYDIEDHKLDTVCRYYHIFRDSAHRASSDCLATGYLFLALLDDIVESDEKIE